jgi:hypothetical protein
MEIRSQQEMQGQELRVEDLYRFRRTMNMSPRCSNTSTTTLLASPRWAGWARRRQRLQHQNQRQRPRRPRRRLSHPRINSCRASQPAGPHLPHQPSHPPKLPGRHPSTTSLSPRSHRLCPLLLIPISLLTTSLTRSSQSLLFPPAATALPSLSLPPDITGTARPL